MAVSVLLYRCEMWVPARNVMNPIERSEMSFLKRTKSCTNRDHLRNDDIRMHVDGMQIRNFP